MAGDPLPRGVAGFLHPSQYEDAYRPGGDGRQLSPMPWAPNGRELTSQNVRLAIILAMIQRGDRLEHIHGRMPPIDALADLVMNGKKD